MVPNGISVNAMDIRLPFRKLQLWTLVKQPYQKNKKYSQIQQYSKHNSHIHVKVVFLNWLFILGLIVSKLGTPWNTNQSNKLIKVN